MYVGANACRIAPTPKHSPLCIQLHTCNCIPAVCKYMRANVCRIPPQHISNANLASKHSPLWMQLHVCKCIPAIVCQNRHFLSTFLVSGRIIKILGTMDEPSSNNHTSLGLFNLVRYSSSSSHLNCPSITF